VIRADWRFLLDCSLSPPKRSKLGSDDRLVNQATSWGAIAGIFYRAILGPTLFTGAFANSHVSPMLPVAIVVVLAGDVTLFIGVFTGRLGWLLRSRVFFVVDVLIAVVLNMWAAKAIPPTTFFQPAQDILWAYAFGTIALWTALRGPRTGAILLTGGAALLLGMAQLNHAKFDLPQYLYRLALLAVAFALPVVFIMMARQTAQLVVKEALRAGRAEERAEMLRTMHDTVLQTLGTIVLRVSENEKPVEKRLQDVRAIALLQQEELRTILAQDDERLRGNLANQLAKLMQEFTARGLRVELVNAELTTDPPDRVVHALVGAIHEALTNVHKHAGVDRAVVRVASSAQEVEVRVRDHGCGFDLNAPTAGYGMAHSIKQRVEAVGGQVQVESKPGQGTRVRLSSRN